MDVGKTKRQRKQREENPVSDMGKNVVLWLVILAVLLTVFSNFNVDSQNPPVKYSEFLSSVENGQVDEVTIQGNRIYATDRSGGRYTVTGFDNDPGLVAARAWNRVPVCRGRRPKRLDSAVISQFPHSDNSRGGHVLYAADAGWR